MAHLSGYSGRITKTVGPAFITTGVESWTVNQETVMHEAYAKGTVAGSDYKTKFATVNRWYASATVLVQDEVVTATLLAQGTAVTVRFIFVGTDGDTIGDRYYAGSGYITSLSTDEPLDGPVRATVEIRGNGALTAVETTA